MYNRGMEHRWCWFAVAFLTASLLIPHVSHARLTTLADDIALAVPLNADTVLCSDAENNLVLLSLPGGERKPWQGRWNAQAAGWATEGHIATLSVSPNGKWVCYCVGVSLPEKYTLQYEGMRYALAVVLAHADGTEANCVALSIEVGGGPEFDFTQDSKRLFGAPFLPCPPTPEEYAAYINADSDSRLLPDFNCIETGTGMPCSIPDLDVGDGFWKCPYSDNYRIENNWYAEHNFSSFATGGLSGSYTTPNEVDCRVFGWVLPDAMLIEVEGQTGLLYTNGEFAAAPWSGMQVYCWLPDGTYLLREYETSPVVHAWVDWDTWSVDDGVTVRDFPEADWVDVIPLLSSKGVLLNEYGPSKLQLIQFE